MKICNSCSREIRPDAVFCPLCGSCDVAFVPEPKKHSRIGSLVKAVLYAAAFLGTQVAVVFVFMLVETFRLSAEVDMSSTEFEALLLQNFAENTILIGIISNLCAVAIFALYFLIRRRKVLSELGFRRSPAVLVPLCAVFGYAMQYVLGFITAILPWPEEWLISHSENMSGASNGSLVLVILGTSVVTGFAEEIFFRALSMDRLGRAFGGVACVVISAVLFGAAHMSPIALFYATVLGVILGCIYRRFNSVWPCVTVHVTFNLASILGLPDDSLLLYFAVTAVCFGISIITAFLIFTREKPEENK